MVELARRRRHRRAVSLSLGDVCDIQQPGASHDTVVDFGIIHHVPQWQQAIAVIARVLRPGGQLLFEEAPRYMLDIWASRTFTVQPGENRCEADESPPNSPVTAFTAPRIEQRLGGLLFVGAARKTWPATPPRHPHRRGRTRPAWPFATTKAAHDVRRHRRGPRCRVRAARRPSAAGLNLNPPIDCGLGGEFRCVAAAGVRAWLSARPRCRVVPLGLSSRGWFGVCC